MGLKMKHNKNIFRIGLAMITSLLSIIHADWTAITGITARNASAFATNGTNLYAGTDAGMYLSTNEGATWTAINSGLSNLNVTCIQTITGAVFAGTMGGGVFVSTNNGSGWTAVNAGLSDLNIMSLAAFGNKVYVGSDGGGVSYTTNNGSTWTTVNAGIVNKHITSFATSGNNLFALTDGGASLLVNGSTTWTVINSGFVNVIDYTVLTTSGTNIFAGTDKGVFVTSNNGASWSLMISGLTNTNATALASNAGTVFVGTDIGVFLSKNNGATWAPATAGLVSTPIIALAVSGTSLLAGTTGIGVLRRPLSEMANSDGIAMTQRELLDFKVSINQQNLYYFLPRNTSVTFKVFDIKGNLRVKAVKESVLGQNSLAIKSWNLPTGKYLLDFTTASFKTYKRLVITP